MKNNSSNVELNLMNAEAKNKIENIRWLVFLLFLSSGISGLVYEVVWSRMLTYIFGATLYAISTVLTSFMGGLALGSFLFGFVADKAKKPLRLYALLELGVGISALLLPFALKSLTPLYQVIYTHFNTSFFAFSLIRFVVTFVVLLIPTTLMGATLPVLSRFFVRKRNSLGLNVGLLYALNTTGAVVGCFISGFYLIASLGISGTILFAAIINIAVAIIGLLLSIKFEKGEAEIGIKEPSAPPIKAHSSLPSISSSENVYSKGVVKFVLFSYFVSGFIALGYQVIWSRSLVFAFDLLKNTTYSFTAMLTVFLIGLALGSAIISKFIDKQTNLLRLFAFIQILIGLSAIFSLFFILNKADAFNPLPPLNAAGDALLWYNAIFNIFSKSFIAIFIPTLMMGMTFPVVSKIFIINLKHLGEGIGKIYSINTLGAILGAFFTGFFIIPAIGIAKGLLLFAVINIVLGAILFIINKNLEPLAKKSYVLLCAAAIAIVSIKTPKQAVFQTIEPGEKLLFYKEGPLATVSVKMTRLGYNEIYVDNVGVAGTDPILLTDQKSLAHIPSLFLPNPQSALTVGFGSGGASFSYLVFDYLKTVDCVEISETVPLAADFLLDSNHNLLQLGDPRYRIIYDDARSYLKLGNKKYDIIATDCTDLRYKTNANLYDFEYFTLCRDKITDDGMVVVWMPLGGLSDECFRSALRTFYRVFPNMSIWYMNNQPTHYILLLGTKSPFTINLEQIQARLQRNKNIRNDLAELYLDNPYKILSCFVTDEKKLNDFLKGNLTNTENYPFLEFNSPKYGYGDKPALDNLNNLMKIREDVTGVLSPINNASLKKEAAEKIKRYEAAIPYIIEGHKKYRLLELEKSCENYIKALQINPDDASVQNLLNYDDIKRKIMMFPYDWWAMNMLGKLYLQQKRYGEAINYFTMITNLDVAFLNNKEASKSLRAAQADAYFNIGKTYIEAGKSERAIDVFKKSLSITPDNKECKEWLEKVQ